VIVEQRVGAVGERDLRQLVQTLVRHLDRVLGDLARIFCERGLHRDTCPLQPAIADQRAQLLGGAVEALRLRGIQQILYSEHDLDLDRGLPLEHLIHVPLAIRGLAPRRPVERDVRNHVRWQAFAGQPVTGLPREVAEEDVGLEVLLERLTFEECGFERVAQCTDGIGEDVVEHADATVAVVVMKATVCVSTVVAMSLVLVDVADGVATLTLNNSAERNTLTAPMVAEIIAAMDEIESNAAVGALVVTGTAPAFCAGANLGNLAESSKESLGGIYEGFLRIARSPLPTLAAVNGAAVGAGMNLALGCDVRLAARRAKFDTRFLQIGIHPGGGHTWMLRRIVGPQATFAGVVFGEVMDGAEAERVGLVHRCYDDDQLLNAAHEMAARAATAPRELLIEVKKTIQDMADIDNHAEAVDRELVPQVWSTRQPWFAERIAALQAKISSRKP